MLKTGTLNTLELMSKEEGKHMDNPESVKVRVLRFLAWSTVPEAAELACRMPGCTKLCQWRKPCAGGMRRLTSPVVRYETQGPATVSAGN